MGKAIEYPKASFKSAQDMANAVDALGGSCSIEMCAEKMGNKISGAFNNIISSAQKFRLITYKTGQLTISQLYRDIKLSYTDQEKENLLISSFLSPPVFSRLYERFKGKELPVSMLDKMLIKEYDVDENVASRIKKYFIEGAKLTGLLNAQNHLISLDLNKSNEELGEVEELQVIQETPSVTSDIPTNYISLSDLDEFVFHITGPGINSKVAIREEEDFIILEAMIKKIKKRFDFAN
jgi:hypothetical protein